MNRNLRLGYSPCPNDTFIFFALAQGRISTAPYELEISLADVEVLNQQARQGLLDITKVSISAVLHLLDDYWLLRAGGAIGRGCGPLVVARESLAGADLRDRTIAVPGMLTTAHLLLEMTETHRGRRVTMPFDRIMKAVSEGEVDAGVIIHEGRFTYPAWGLNLVLDLGAWWEEETRLPLPLGGILIKRELGTETARWVDERIRGSLLYARSHPQEAWPYIKAHAQEMADEVIGQHIETFVNEFSLDVGEEGERAIRFLLEAAAKYQGLALPRKPIFWNQHSASQGEKTGLVLQALAKAAGPFRIAELRNECPNVSVDMIRRVLKDLRAKNRVECLGRGQNAQWCKTDEWELGNETGYANRRSHDLGKM